MAAGARAAACDLQPYLCLEAVRFCKCASHLIRSNSMCFACASHHSSLASHPIQFNPFKSEPLKHICDSKGWGLFLMAISCLRQRCAIAKDRPLCIKRDLKAKGMAPGGSKDAFIQQWTLLSPRQRSGPPTLHLRTQDPLDPRPSTNQDRRAIDATATAGGSPAHRQAGTRHTRKCPPPQVT